MQVVVCGLGNFGYSVATTLAELGGEVIAIDTNESLIEAIKDQVGQAVCADATDEKVLRALGVPEVDAAVVAIGGMDQSAITTIVLRRIGVSRIFARAISDEHARVLDEVGASRIIKIEEQMGEQVAHILIAPHVLERSTFAPGHSLVELRAPRKLIGKTIRDARLREDHHINLVAIQRRSPTIDDQGRSVLSLTTNAVPEADDVINEGDILVLAGADEAIERFLEGGE
jgi:trk system potassium uptake protein TrkA